MKFGIAEKKNDLLISQLLSILVDSNKERTYQQTIHLKDSVELLILSECRAEKI